MVELNAGDFRQFFYELHGKSPFPWQEVLAERVCSGGWLNVDVPTGSGKTACLDIALFALALRGEGAPRRIFFVVDRRVVVNEAFLRMQKIRDKLCDPKSKVLESVSGRLKALAGGDEPIKVYEMRGGAFRDETWVKNPLQPAVIASTVDQVGSRLLFRGYGVSRYSWPLHAGLIANDALIILDEAHCSLAFAQTLDRVKKYRGDDWAEEPLQAPFHFVEMTATPSRPDEERIQITDADRSHDVFGKRLRAAKPVRLVVEVKSKKDDFSRLADALVAEAIALAASSGAKRVAILVNRVRTAKIVSERLIERGKDATVELVIGRMRPVDRDDLYRSKLKNLKSGVERQPDDPLTFVVSTQCLEVGADLDFDVLVSECASIDALLQRFGRLDRLGDLGRARGAIVIGSWQVNPKQPDPIYGAALSNTWEWLKSVAGESSEVNLGIESADGLPTVAQLLNSIDSTGLRLAAEAAPVLLPTHVDALVQTSPVPEPDPLIELFLHGLKRGAPDVQVLWRADLPEDAPKLWPEIVSLCPPSSRECMPVQIGVFKKWFAGEKNADESESDLEIGVDEDAPKHKSAMRALAWNGNDSKVIENVNEIRPGQTFVLPQSAGGWDVLGHVPEGAVIDVGDRAAFEIRRSVSLRLHPKLTKTWPETAGREAIREYVSKLDASGVELEELLISYYDGLSEPQRNLWPSSFLHALQEKKLVRRELNTYPDEETLYVFEARKSEKNEQVDEPVPLDRHLREVEHAVATFGARKLGPPIQSALKLAARFHDYGKADVRYQAWLRGGDVMAARYAPNPIAKSGNVRAGRQESVGLPSGFRHELLSLLFAERSDKVNGDSRELVLHLIASHHGRCRPFAPVIIDDAAECISFDSLSVCRQERIDHAPHRLSSGVSERFWKLTHKYGWWGLPYLESLLRLADWRASEEENAEVSNA